MASVELVQWTSDQAAVLARGLEQGVVVDIALAKLTAAVSSKVAHSEAAFMGVGEFSRVRRCEVPGSPPQDGRRSTTARFYGSGFDHRSGAVTLWPRTSGQRWGFADAFMLPPYDQLTRREAETLFAQVNRLILGSPADDTEIWEWSTDWAEYFEAGNDWVGAAVWTVGAQDDHIAILGYSPVE